MGAPTRSFSAGGLRWRLGPGVDPARGRALVGEALRLRDAGEPRKRGRRKRLYALALGGGAPDHLLKEYDYAGGDGARRYGASRARAELARAAAAVSRGVATPVPIAAGERRRLGRLERCALLVPLVPGARDLAEVVRAGDLEPAARRRVASALGALARRMHDAGIRQDDFAPNNFLLCAASPADPSPRILAIDFERAGIQRRLAPGLRRAMLAKLDRYLGDARSAERLRFLCAYTGDRRDARRLWRELERERAALVRRDLRHQRRAATRESRRFARLESTPGLEASAVRRGWRRRDARDDALRRALDDGDPHAAFVCELDGVGPDRAAELWALAQALYLRRLVPRPDALVMGEGRASLVFERSGGARRLDDVDAGSALRGPLAVLLDHLLCLGIDPARCEPAGFVALGPSGPLRLLDPRPIELGRPSPAPRRAAARSLAERLLG